MTKYLLYNIIHSKINKLFLTVGDFTFFFFLLETSFRCQSHPAKFPSIILCVRVSY